MNLRGGGATYNQAPSSVLAESNGITRHPEPKAKDPIKKQVDSSVASLLQNDAQGASGFLGLCLQNDKAAQGDSSGIRPQNDIKKDVILSQRRRIHLKHNWIFHSVQNDMKKSKHAAFTMAEVLITIGIIGIVAAMTLPGVIEGYQKAETINRLKKAYSVMAQAIELSEVQYESVKYWNFNQSPASFFNQYLKPHFAKINETTYGKISDKVQYTRPNGSVENNFTPFYSNALVVSTVDGMTFYITGGSTALTRKSLLLVLDLNGYKKPNRIGRDVFMFSISQEYGLVPYGYKGTCDMGNAYDTFDREYLKSAWRYGCSKQAGETNGAFCSALIMTDGWEIRDDYPW